MLDHKTKQKIIARHLKTDQGRRALAVSMIKPLIDRIAYFSIPALILKTNEWNEMFVSGMEWLYDNYFLAKNKQLKKTNQCCSPEMFKFKVKPEFEISMIQGFDKALDVVTHEFYGNENEVFWNLIEKTLKKKLIKSISRKKITLDFLEKMSEKHDYLVTTAGIYSTIRKIIAASPNYSTNKNWLKTSGLGRINKMQLIISRSAPKDCIFFFTRSSGEMTRNIDNISISTKNKKVKTIFEQQFNCTIDPKQIFVVKGLTTPSGFAFTPRRKHGH